MGMLALSFNLLFGYMGQMSFSQAAFCVVNIRSRC
jgi:ABC-type branched-subunit amino acid transport system permease subunit